MYGATVRESSNRARKGSAVRPASTRKCSLSCLACSLLSPQITFPLSTPVAPGLLPPPAEYAHAPAAGTAPPSPLQPPVNAVGGDIEMQQAR
jgi:hypothetical protein